MPMSCYGHSVHVRVMYLVGCIIFFKGYPYVGCSENNGLVLFGLRWPIGHLIRDWTICDEDRG